MYVKNTNATVMNTVAKSHSLKSGTPVEPQAPPSLKVKSNIRAGDAYMKLFNR
jgi:hypothetical protein